MVLLQVVIDGVDANSKIRSVVPCPFNGRYKVKYLSYELVWSNNPNILLRVNSQDLLGNFVGGQLIVGSNTGVVRNMDTSKFEFICDKLNGSVDLELTDLDGTTPAGFSYGIFNFDFEKIDER